MDFLAAENNVKVASVTVPASNASGNAPANALVSKTQFPAKSAAPSTKFVVDSDKRKPARIAAVQTTASAKPVLQKTAVKKAVAKKAAKPAAKAAGSSGGTHLVQLGAFSSPEGAKRAWGILSAQNADLNSFEYASSRINVKGRTLYRLAAIGFGNQRTAEAMCAGIKAKGGNCIVRHATGVNKVAPSRMASQSETKLAAR